MVGLSEVRPKVTMRLPCLSAGVRSSISYGALVMKSLIAAMMVLYVPLAGCVHTKVTVKPSEIATRLPELAASGSITVPVQPTGTRQLGAKRVVSVRLRAGNARAMRRMGRLHDLTLATLVANCGSAAVGSKAPSCLLGEAEQITLSRSKRVNWSGIMNAAVGIAVLGGLGGLGYCASECAGPWDTASTVSLVALGIAAVYVMVVGIRAWARHSATVWH